MFQINLGKWKRLCRFLGPFGLEEVDDLTRKDFAELDALLVKRIDIPDEPLKGDLVFVVGEKFAERVGSEAVCEEDPVGAVAVEGFIGVVARFSLGESDRL